MDFIKRIWQRLLNEPVMIVTALIMALTALQDSLNNGLSVSTAILAAVQALLGYFAREQVWGPKTAETLLKAQAEVKADAVVAEAAAVAEAKAAREG